ncbi:hypothetical protein KI387_032299, partial [Taxus chinensis]
MKLTTLVSVINASYPMFLVTTDAEDSGYDWDFDNTLMFDEILDLEGGVIFTNLLCAKIVDDFWMV